MIAVEINILWIVPVYLMGMVVGYLTRLVEPKIMDLVYELLDKEE
jgi:hypothetical protein